MDKPNTTFGKTLVKSARKKHTCSWCAEKIEAGQSYSRHTGVWDGEFQSNAMHPECDEAFDRSSECEYYIYDNQRGISMDERESFEDGVRAREEGTDRAVPEDVSKQGEFFAAAWIRGWDEAITESEATNG